MGFPLCVFSIGGCNEVYAATTLELAVSGQVVVDSGEWVTEVLEGARLCQTGTTDNCELSDARGRVSIELPVGEEISYTLEKEGYASYLSPDFYDTPLRSAYERALPRDSNMARIHWQVDESPYPMRGTGTININIFPRGLADATFESTHQYAHLGQRAQLRLVADLEPSAPPHVNLRSTSRKR